MTAHWWAFVPLAVLLAAVAAACLRDGRRRLSKALGETPGRDGSRP